MSLLQLTDARANTPVRERARTLTRALERLSRAAVALTLIAAIAPMADAQEAPTDKLIGAAYKYAFPLFKLSQYRWTALETTDARTSTTLNQFAHARRIATPDDRWANSPIVDALYSTAWIDLAHGPVILNTPDTGKRYFVLTLIDFYSNTFFYAGHRTTGTAPQRYYVVGPDWRGAVPEGLQLVRAPTSDLYINLRVQVDGPADAPAANAIQDGFRITPATPGRVADFPARIRPLTDSPQNLLVLRRALKIAQNVIRNRERVSTAPAL